MTWAGGEAFYLDERPSRPVFQGDVFRDVPFVKVRRGNRFEDDPNTVAERRYVALIGNPCDLYAVGSGRLAKVQTVAVVRPLKQSVPDDLDGYFECCPMPPPIGEGEVWCIDFRLVSNVDAFYLRPDNRVACLSEAGWTFLRFRKVLCETRIRVPMGDLRESGRVQWDELALWETWVRSGRDPSRFPAWMDELRPELGGATPRLALESGYSTTVIANAAGIG